jgi:CubicO group peptidase (beta-lactamase class C family)
MKRRPAIAMLMFFSLVLHAPGLLASPQQQTGGERPPEAPNRGDAPPPAVDTLSAALRGEVDGIVAAAMDEWSIPGLALAIIADGDVVLAQGYGYRHAESKLAVTPGTLFPIASLTKPFTATLLATLVDDGILQWDRPVVEYLPDFRLSDEHLTHAVTARDLVTHQSGLPRHDFVWYGTDLSPHELYERLRFLEPSEPLRGEWQYQNLMFMTAGYLAAEVSGSSWERLVEQRLLAPLEMEDATFSLRQLKERADIAFPYAEGAHGPRRVPFRSMDAVGPAGSISATVEELSRFVSMLVNEGRYDGHPVVSPAVVRHLLEPQVDLPAEAVDPALGASAYGLGLVLSTYDGERMAHHEGGVDGFVSLLSFLPDAKIGVVVLTNYSGDNPVPWIVTRHIYDRLLQRPRRDWMAYARDTATLRQSQPRRTPVASGPVGTWRSGPARPLLADYAGSYWHPAYGEVDIVLGGGTLSMRFHGIDATLEPAGKHRYRVSDGPLRGLSLAFFGNGVNRIDRVAIPWEPEVSDIVFTRRVIADGHDERRP